MWAAAAGILSSAGTISAVFIRKGLQASGIKDGETSAAALTLEELREIEHGTPCEPHKALAKDVERHEVLLSEDFKKAFSEIFDRLASLTNAVLDSTRTTSDVRADLAFLKARIDPPRSSEHLKPLTDEIQIKDERDLLIFVDDRADSMGALIRMIENVGFRVSVAKSFEEAQTAMTAFHYDIAVIDASLSPNTLDGVQLAKWATDKFTEMRVFLYSGYEVEQIPAHCRFFSKVDFRLLLTALEESKARGTR
jgi:CheY-like chemotaxis protein